MNKLFHLIFAAILLVTVSLAALVLVANKINREAESALNNYAEEIGNYNLNNSHYPTTITDIRVEREKVFYLFQQTEIHYQRSNQVLLWYSEFPLGPKRVYNLDTGELTFEE